MGIVILPNRTQVVSGAVTVQGADGVAPVKVDGSAVTQPVAIVADPTQPVPVAGNVVVDILAVGGIPIPPGVGVPVSVIGSSLNATVLQGTSPWVENLSQVGGSPVVTGTGLSGLGVPRVTVSSDSSLSVPAGEAATLLVVQIAVQQLQLLQAILQAINSVAGQLGAVPASVNSAASTPLN